MTTRNLVVRASPDDGQTWPTSRVLHEGPAAYSSLTVLNDGSIACLYERGTTNSYETITLQPNQTTQHDINLTTK